MNLKENDLPTIVEVIFVVPLKSTTQITYCFDIVRHVSAVDVPPRKGFSHISL